MAAIRAARLEDLPELTAIYNHQNAVTAAHERFGFRAVGQLSEVGRKFDRYWDVAWFERALGNAEF